MNLQSRRQMLANSSLGFGALAAQGMFLEAQAQGKDSGESRTTHHRARARHVILCYMSGGVSHVDSFDPKPRLQAENGKPMPVPVERTQFNNNGNIMASRFRFSPSGQSGIPVSSMFPQVATVADELAVIRSMTTTVNEHAQGNFLLHSGFPFMGYPSAGAWLSYGLGTENQNLPSYVVLQSGNAVPPHGGVALFSNAFLPGQFQGSILKADQEEAITNLRASEPRTVQRRRLDLIRKFDVDYLSQSPHEARIEAAIRNYETAYRMQAAVPELCDISGESDHTHELYGLNSADQETAAYGRQCLLARRLVERGVRFIELSCLTKGIGAGGAANPWDQHGDLHRGHEAMARQVDQPIAGLIKDLKARGLLDETLIIWTGEFGRTPFSQGSGGRDHNPFGFSIWMAGGGIRGGTIYGATDEYGYHAIENKCDPYDMWATVLHLLGMNHERLTFRYGGRDLRLTDVYGRVIPELLA